MPFIYEAMTLNSPAYNYDAAKINAEECFQFQSSQRKNQEEEEDRILTNKNVRKKFPAKSCEL